MCGAPDFSESINQFITLRDMMETVPHGVLPLVAKHDHPTAVPDMEELEPQIVDSPDAMGDGSFPTPAQSPVKKRQDGEGLAGGMVNGGQGITSPFPLQGPIVLSNSAEESKGIASASPLAAVTPLQDEPTSTEEPGFASHTEKESTAGSRLSMRVAPASPSPSHAPSPALSRRASSQALPPTATIQILQNGTLVESVSDTRETNPEAEQVSVSRSGSLGGKTRPRSATTTGSGSSSSIRSRRPSTLIPQPGREGETIPPRYRGAEGDAEGSAVQEDDVGDRVVDGTSINSTESRTISREPQADGVSEIEQQQAAEQPRVIVRDFGFPASDPRYRGAFHPIPGEEEDEEDDDRSTAGSTASGASSGWNRFAGGVRRKSSLGGGWSGFGFGGFGFGGLSRRFSKSSRRGSQAGLSGAGGDDAESNLSGSRRGSLQVGGAAESSKSPVPGGIVLPPPGPDTDISLSDLTPSSSVDDEPAFGRQYVFGAGGGSLMKRGNSSGSRLRALSGAGNDTSSPLASGAVTPITIPEESHNSFATPIATSTAEDARLSILSQVSEEGQSDASSADEAAKWPSDPAAGNSSSVSSGTTVTAREPRGRYTVLYEFEAEGEHEMSVAEGEVLLVGGRWGNMGWVIAERLNARDGQVAKGLVPEGYLGDKLGDR